MNTTIQYYRVQRRQISFIKFILEAYDNMALTTTLDPHQAIVRVAIAPGCEKEICAVLDGFAQDFEIVALDRVAVPAARG